MSVWLSPLCFVFHFLIETEYLHAACMEIYCAFKLFFFLNSYSLFNNNSKNAWQKQNVDLITNHFCCIHIFSFGVVIFIHCISWSHSTSCRMRFANEGLSLSCCVGYKVMPHRCGWMRNLNWITCIVCGKIGWNSLSTTSVLYFRTHPQMDVVCGGPSNGWKSN